MLVDHFRCRCPPGNLLNPSMAQEGKLPNMAVSLHSSFMFILIVGLSTKKMGLIDKIKYLIFIN